MMSDKKKFFEELFIEKVIKHERSRDGKFVDVAPECTNPVLRAHISRLYNKYKFKENMYYQDLLDECMYWSYVSIMKFVPEEGDWASIADGTNKKAIGQVIKYIQTTLDFRINDWVNEDSVKTRKSENGNAYHLIINLDNTSLEGYLEGSIAFDEIVGDIDATSNLFRDTDFEYKFNHFVQWFQENKETLLTKKQLDLVNAISEGADTEEDRLKAPKYNKRILSRVELAWNEQGMKEKSMIQLEKEEELKIFNELLDIIHSSPEGMNNRVSEWIIANYDRESVWDLVQDNFSKENIILANQLYKGTAKGWLPAICIYNFVSVSEKYIKELQKVEEVVKEKIESTYDYSGWIKQQQKARKADCIVFDSEGNVLRVEEWKPEKTSKTRILWKNTDGILIDKNESVF